MKKVITLIMLCLIAAIVVPVFAADKPAGDKPAAPVVKEQTITGKVSVVKDKEGKVTEITLTAGEVKYKVSLINEEGKKLAALDGKEVKATGKVHENKEGVKILTVEKFEEVKAAPKATPKK